MPGTGNPHLSCLLLVQEDQGVLFADPEPESKTLLLKMPQTWDIGVRGIKQELRWKPPARGLDFIIHERTMQTA